MTKITNTVADMNQFATKEQGTKADNAVQPIDLKTISFLTRAQLISHLTSVGAVNGREYRVSGLSWVGSTGATIIPDLPGLLPVSPVHPEHFKENTTPGVTEMADAVQNAVNAGYSVYGIPGVNYKLSSMIRITTDNITIDFSNNSIDATAFRDSGTSPIEDRTDGLFDILGTLKLQTTLSASVAVNSTTITLTSVVNIEPGDVLYLRSVNEHWYTTDVGAQTKFHPNRVKSVSGSVVTVESPFRLSFDTGISEVNVFVWKGVQNSIIKAGRVVGPGFVENRTNGIGESFVSGFYTQNLIVEAQEIIGFQGYCVRSGRYWNTKVSISHMQGYPDGYNPTIIENENSGFYGVVFYQGAKGWVTNSYGTRLRHMIDGMYAWDVIVSGNTSDGGWRSSYSSHENCNDWIFQGNIAFGTGGAALLWRGFNLQTANNNWDTSGRSQSYGFQDAVGAPDDMPREYVFSGDNINTTRSAILLQAKIKSATIIPGRFIGGMEAGHSPILIETPYFDYISIQGGSIKTITATRAIVVQDKSPTVVDRKVMKINNVYIRGYSDAAYYSNHTTRPNVSIVEDNIFDPVGSPTTHVNVPAANLRWRGHNALIDGTVYNPDA